MLAGAALFACMTDLVAGIARLSDSAAARHGQTAQLAAAPAATLPRQDPTPRACSGRPDPLGPSRLVYSSRLKVDALCRGRLPSGGNNKASTKGCKKGPACGGPRGEASPRGCQRVNCGSALLPAHSRLTHRLGPCRRHGWSTRVCSCRRCSASWRGTCRSSRPGAGCGSTTPPRPRRWPPLTARPILRVQCMRRASAVRVQCVCSACARVPVLVPPQPQPQLEPQSSFWPCPGAVIAPMMGCDSATDYYTQASSGPLLTRARVSTAC